VIVFVGSCPYFRGDHGDGELAQKYDGILILMWSVVVTKREREKTAIYS